MTDELDELEDKIQKGKEREEALRRRIEKRKARLDEAQRQLEALQSEVEEEGYELQNLDEAINELKSNLTGKVASYHQALDEAEERLDEYKDT
jgi:chromosome segregation ATPase